MTLDDWLAHGLRLHPKAVDMTLARTRSVRERLDLRFTAPVIAVAGTNGKGSTCAMLEAIALQAGYRVGLYSKPHLVRFEERCRVNGQRVGASELLAHFEAVEAARGETRLTHFEFTTLAIARALATTALDLVILEVGMGGRLDAVNAFDADCAVITSIDIDHAEFLGPDRETIAIEKAGIMRPGKPVIVSDPAPPRSLRDAAARVGADLWQIGRDFQGELDGTRWHWSGRGRRFPALERPSLQGENQLLNASGALAAFEALRAQVPITAQDARRGLATVDLPGRFQVVSGRPVLVLDVAHNPHAVAALARNLDRMGGCRRTHAVFGAMADKDLRAMLAQMVPLVDHWHVTDLPLPRAASAASLQALLRAADIEARGAAPCSTHAGPRQAMAAARDAAGPDDRIVVFGSFHTVGAVLQHDLARHPAAAETTGSA